MTSDFDIRHGDRAIVLKPLLKTEHARRDPIAMLDEAIGLARAIELSVVEAAVVNIGHATPGTLFGKGQVENFGEVIATKEIALAVIDHALSPVQQRNLERDWKCKVIDRTGLILEIFGERARTREGMLQVELAALDYQKSRLVRSWTHLERQRGGFGFLGGPGESQLEMDRRLIDARIVKLKEELKQVRRTRGLQREQRQRAGHPTIALVGYTNAGKSSLFNRLTGADALAKDMLFATLDPTMRGIKLSPGREAILSDTVGFVSDLPTHLIEAFRATLEEVQLADIILHVRDATHPETGAQRDAVMGVLADLGVEHEDERLIEVQNKIDLIPEDDRKQLLDYTARMSWDAQHARPLEGLRREPRGGIIGVSALTGEGIPELLKCLEEKLAARSKVYEIAVPLTDGAAISWLHAHGKVLDKRDTKTKSRLKVELDAADFGRYESRFGKASS
ncbi:MAG: GTPase HflX [Pseudomonadota bacterium]|nr:GTPase HflX [Pseudomonadota bacterium]